MPRLNESADLLRDVTQARVAAAGPNFRFVDAVGPFRGHGVCSQQEWLNGLSNPKGESLHPNVAGHSAGYVALSVAFEQERDELRAPADAGLRQQRADVVGDRSTC